MKICIFPGTFNPIHDGHLKMAEYALKKHNFDKVIFIPAYIPPHKNVDKNLANHRLNMVKLAVSKEPKFEVSDIEYSSENKSYTINTVQKIIEKFNIKEKLNFIIGTDAFINLKNWYKPEELKKLVHFIVFPRLGSVDEQAFKTYRENGWDFELTTAECINISSTDIRKNNLKNSMNKEVEEYIKNNGLY